MSVVTFKYSIGDKVHLSQIDRPGVVSALLQDSESNQYRVIWWWDGVRRSEWLYEFELNNSREN
jgi:hypothetical protein